MKNIKSFYFILLIGGIFLSCNNKPKYSYEAYFDKAPHYLSSEYFLDNTFYLLITYKIGTTKVIKGTFKG